MTSSNSYPALLACVVVWFCLNLLVQAAASDVPEAFLVRRPVNSAGLWQYRKEIATNGSSGGLQGRIFPAQPTATRLPLVVFLHGSGERGADNIRQLWLFPQLMVTKRYYAKFPCILLAPQCPEGSNWIQHRTQVMQLIDDVARTYPVDRDRIYLTGLSMGGFGAWDLAAHYPDVFAAVVPVCGGGDPATAQALVKVPVWAVHGDADQSVDVGATRRMITALRQVGATPEYSELPGVGHDSYHYAYDLHTGVLDWMFRQHKERGGP